MDGVIVIDKPSGITSHGVVDVLRKAIGLKRIGHTGTLDPMATGVMVLLLGRATRIGRFLELEPKEYIAEALFGVVTDTQDITGKVTRESAKEVDVEDIKRLIPDFTGEIYQIPPMVSAIKIGGKPLYKLARQGKVVERPERRVTIYEFELLDFFETEGRQKAVFRVLCSGGTYVRTLIHDLGERLGTGATLSSLRRTKVGKFTLHEAVNTDKIKSDTGIIFRNIISMDDALPHLAEVIVKDSAVSPVLNGRRLQDNMLESHPETAELTDYAKIKSTAGKLLAIGRVTEKDHTVIAPEVVFNR